MNDGVPWFLKAGSGSYILVACLAIILNEIPIDEIIEELKSSVLQGASIFGYSFWRRQPHEDYRAPVNAHQ